jgi:type III secretion protein Q
LTQDATGRQYRGLLVLENQKEQSDFLSFCAGIEHQEDPIWEDIPLSSRFEVGQTQISLRELRTLQVNDMLAVDRWYAVNQRLISKIRLVGYKDIHMVGEIDQDKIVVTEIKRNTMSQYERSGQESLSDVDNLDALEVTVTFDLGDISLPLKEVKKVQPGYTFTLDQPLEQSMVNVRANGGLIGTGQLVAVGEKLGIRIMKFAEHASE